MNKITAYAIGAAVLVSAAAVKVTKTLMDRVKAKNKLKEEYVNLTTVANKIILTTASSISGYLDQCIRFAVNYHYSNTKVVVELAAFTKQLNALDKDIEKHFAIGSSKEEL